MTLRCAWVISTCCLLLSVSPLDDLAARTPAGARTATGHIDFAEMQEHTGFFGFLWDESTGKIWLRIGQLDEPFLYVSSLASGLGSNPVGLDRGQLGESRVVRFRRVGPKVYLEHVNLKYRANTENRLERRAVRDSFASSILWSGDVKRDANQAIVVDMTGFLLRDAHDCVGILASNEQGSFSLDADRSFVFLPRTKAFPNNTEFEAALTFVSSKPGVLAQRTSADGRALTLRQHHSFVRLPDGGYSPRRYDPRSGCFKISYSDYAARLDQPLEQHFITRHRLKKRDPDSAKSPAVEPIVYYLDPGVPEPVRGALIEGAEWWNDAFEEAGFTDAFQVRVLPADADPMDVRFNVIQWVHRATRGWSYGQSVIDPRTGEIIKGHVLLGSLRVRQDNVLMEGLGMSGADLAKASSCGGMVAVRNESYLATIAENQTSLEVALARIRQLSAHEVGHTLGFAHNFAASTYADRASVMDYPAPRATAVGKAIDLSDAYGTGIGAWDKFIVKYAYTELHAQDEKRFLGDLIKEAVDSKMLYVSDADARPAGAAHPLGNLWDNGTEPVGALRNAMRVRRIAMDQFDASVLKKGQPLADLEAVFVPVFLHHRYQVVAAAKMLGGVEYSYTVLADGQTPLRPVRVANQRQALRELLATIRPSELVIPSRILRLIPPKAHALLSDRERFSSRTSPLFDPASAVRVAADLTLSNLLQPERASRLARTDQADWGLDVVIDAIVEQAWDPDMPETFAAREATRIVRQVVIDRLIRLADSGAASYDARAISLRRLKRTRRLIEVQKRSLASDRLDSAHADMMADEIDRYLERPHQSAKPADTVQYPPGSPIGEVPR